MELILSAKASRFEEPCARIAGPTLGAGIREGGIWKQVSLIKCNFLFLTKAQRAQRKSENETGILQFPVPYTL